MTGSARWGWGLATWLVFVVFLSTRPGSALPQSPFVFFGVDKVAHLILYAPLGVCLARLWRTPGGTRLVVIGVATLLGALVGAADEAMQSTIPGRSSTLGDVVADCVGAALGAALGSRRSKPA